jgi:hypothetical protein
MWRARAEGPGRCVVACWVIIRTRGPVDKIHKLLEKTVLLGTSIYIFPVREIEQDRAYSPILHSRLVATVMHVISTYQSRLLVDYLPITAGPTPVVFFCLHNSKLTGSTRRKFSICMQMLCNSIMHISHEVTCAAARVPCLQTRKISSSRQRCGSDYRVIFRAVTISYMHTYVIRF